MDNIERGREMNGQEKKIYEDAIEIAVEIITSEYQDLSQDEYTQAAENAEAYYDADTQGIDWLLSYGASLEAIRQEKNEHAA